VRQSVQRKLSWRRYASVHNLCRIVRSSIAHRTESMSVIGHELTMGVSFTGSVQKQRNVLAHVTPSGAK